MTLDEARSILGITASASTDDVRDAYRALLRTHHPDLAGPDSTARAARVIEAYTVVSAEPPGPPPSPTSPTTSRAASSSPRPPTTDAGADEILLPDATRAVFEQLREAADVLGDVSYVDAQNGILETIVPWDSWPASSLLVTLQQRGDTTYAQCELESLDSRRPGPPIDKVVRELQRIMDALAE